MLITISAVIAAALVLFLGFVATRESKFDYKKSGILNATPEEIFPFLSNFKLGKEWNPYDQKDPNIKRNFIGVDGTVGSKMEFAGNRQAGSGNLEILKIEPNKMSLIKLVMTKPIHVENFIEYTLEKEENGTNFTWRMYGDGGFMGKLMGVLIDCESMILKDFDKGITNLKKRVESIN